jgi:hypothetical protein
MDGRSRLAQTATFLTPSGGTCFESRLGLLRLMCFMVLFGPSKKIQDIILNWAMADFFHILFNSWFTIIEISDVTDSDVKYVSSDADDSVQNGVAVTLWICISELLGSYLDWDISCLLSSFVQYLQEDFGVVLRIGHDRFLPDTRTWL